MNNQVHSDILIIGAGVGGAYFGWLMAEKGYSVTIIDQQSGETVGQHPEVVYFSGDHINDLGVLKPVEGAPEFIGRNEDVVVFAPDAKIKRSIKMPLVMLKLQTMLQRLYGLLDAHGVDLQFSCVFKKPIFENGKITGVVAEKHGEKVYYSARIIIDASGTPGVLRTALPDDYGVETRNLTREDVIYVTMRTVKWKEPYNGPSSAMLDLLHMVFFDPMYPESGAMIATAHMGSSEKADRIMDDFLNTVYWPEFEVVKQEQGILPFKRPSHSLVADNLLLIGDAAIMPLPKPGHMITAIWELCRIAADVVGDALRDKSVILTKEKLWNINVRYFRNQGAQFASMSTQLLGFAHLTKRELNYIMKSTEFINIEKILTDTRILLTPGQYAKLAGMMTSGIFTRKLSLKNLKSVGRMSVLADFVRFHYKNFPDNPNGLKQWKEKTESLWKRKRPVSKAYPSTTVTYH